MTTASAERRRRRRKRDAPSPTAAAETTALAETTANVRTKLNKKKHYSSIMNGRQLFIESTISVRVNLGHIMTHIQIFFFSCRVEPFLFFFS